MQKLWIPTLARASRLLSLHLKSALIITWAHADTVRNAPTFTEISANSAAWIAYTPRMKRRETSTIRLHNQFKSVCVTLIFLTRCHVFRAVYVSTKSTWKSPLPWLVRETKPAVFAWKSSGRSCLPLNNVSDCYPTVRTVSGQSRRRKLRKLWISVQPIGFVCLFVFATAWTAYASGDRRNSLRIRSSGRARNAESSLISCAPVVTGVKRKKRRKSWSPITRGPWGNRPTLNSPPPHFFGCCRSV